MILIKDLSKLEDNRRKRIFVKRNSLLAKIACGHLKTKAVALVLGQTIHLYGVNPISLLANKDWLAHELVHVKQYEKYGVLRFLGLYIWDWIKHGYFRNRYEEEARGVKNQPDSLDIFEEYDFVIK